MKKTTVLGWLIPFFTVVALTSCATLPVKPITQADLPDLKGEWKGYYEEDTSKVTEPIELTIYSGLMGSMTWHRKNEVPNTHTFSGSIEDGRIKSSWGTSQINLQLRKGEGKMRFEGNWKAGQYQGTLYLNKVK